jgi:hypothetical protein
LKQLFFSNFCRGKSSKPLFSMFLRVLIGGVGFLRGDNGAGRHDRGGKDFFL